MTVLRREDVQSNLANWDNSPYRMHNPPVLAIGPLIIRRLRGPSPTAPSFSLLVTDARARYSAAAGAGCSAAHTKPANSRAIATAIFGGGLCSAANLRKRRHNRCWA